MNKHQAAVRLKNVLRALRWGSTGDPAFGPGSVKITAGFDAKSAERLVMPYALVRMGTSVRDPQDGGDDSIYKTAAGITLACAMPGDEFGEAALLGGNRAGGATSNTGRGLLELEGLVLPAIHELGPKDGFVVSHVASSIPEAAFDTGRGYVVAETLQFDAYHGAAPAYMVARSFAASVAGSVVSLSWAAPDDTTDLVKYVLRRVSGKLPVARPTEGTGITLGSALATSVNDSPGSGTWAYSLFAMYAEPGGTLGRYYSDMVDVTGVV